MAVGVSQANLAVPEMPKSPSPPVLPAVRLERVVRFARADAIGVFVCAGAGLLLAAASESWGFAAFAALALVGGGMEWHGQDRLRAGSADGMQWLTGAQLCLYTVILGYAAWRWRFFDPTAYWAEIPELGRSQLEEQMRASGLDPAADRELLLRTMNALVCLMLVGIGTLYQGGVTIWYRLQSRAVAEALENPSTARGDAG